MTRTMLLLGLALAGCTGAAAQPAPDGTHDAAAATAKAARPVCRSEATTGSVMPERTCHTREEWKLIEARNGSAADAFMGARDRAGPSGGR